jgi:hypothetical protein
LGIIHSAYSNFRKEYLKFNALKRDRPIRNETTSLKS